MLMSKLEMEKFLFLLSGTVLLLHHYLFPCLAITRLTTDETALLALKSHIKSPSSVFAHSWSTHTSCCNWTGITCSSRHQRVTALNISNMGITGTIPPHIGNLSFLTLFSIRNNSFFGELPHQLSYLRRLKIMDLRSNKFNGNIPLWIGDFPQLQRLLISFNSFFGYIPPSIYNNMSSLQMLDLGDNRFIGSLPEDMCDNFSQLVLLYLHSNQLEGPITSNIQKCRQLQILSFMNNKLSGSIPKEIGNLTMLTQLYLANNKLSGSIPKEIGNLTMLTLLDIQSNNLDGGIPHELGNLQNLKTIVLATCGLSGFIPPVIFNISTLKIISLNHNNFSGHLPHNIGVGLVNLIGLYLAENKLSGTIPSSISNASMLTTIGLSTNSFTGFIPDSLGTLQLLESLDLEYNFLTIDSSSQELRIITSLTSCLNLINLDLSGNEFLGSLPISVGNFSSLETFSVRECSIKGNIPREIGNMSNLISLKLDDNKLSGSIPVSVGILQMLQALELAGNNLEGPIPYDICLLKRLTILSLFGNELSGHIPACIGNNLTFLLQLRLNSNKLTSTIPSTLGNIRSILTLDLSSNSLTGNLPLEIGRLKEVIVVDISGNQLSGNIPTIIGDIQSLVNLSLAHNKLQGLIPTSFENLISLEFLDLSDNKLSGAIPMSLEGLKYLKFFNVSSNMLCGEIPNAGPFLNFSAKSFLLNDELCGVPRFDVPLCKNSISRETVVFVLKYVLPAVAIIVFALIFLYVRCRKKSEMIPNSAESLPIVLRRISYREIVRATDGFNECMLLGKGSFGNVYKAIFYDGEIFAIKVFNLLQEGAFKSFDVECEILRNIRHRNLIKIISSCSNNHDFKALVLEYVPNGNLDKWLYSHNYYLNTLQRLNIMIDVALALEYLHHGYTTPIVHCDLKPSNILLDVDMVAHVGDFGISKLLGEGDFMRQTMTLATIGYMAPEYGSEGIVSTKGDVYSYGIMLMETFTRKKPTHEYFTDEMNLKRWVSDYSVIDVADYNLLRSGEEHFIANKQCISSVLTLALNCCADAPEERIDMKDVVVGLVNIKKKNFP